MDWTPPAGFEETAPSELHDTVPMPLHAEQDPLSVLREKYPRIHRRIVLDWGTQQLADQFNRWIFTDQDGREGFSNEVGTALLNLSIAHERQFHLEGAVFHGGKKDKW